MTEVHFTDHAIWRAVERHGSSVCLDILAEEIAAAIEGGWHSHDANYETTVVIKSGERFVVRPADNGVVVVTALGKEGRVARPF